MKTAFLFAGQGSQYTGMGKDLYEHHEIIRQTFAESSEILGYDAAAICFAAENEDKLQQTLYLQPVMVTLAVAIWRLLQQKKVTADYVAGFSLGEYAALVASNTLTFKQSLKLVQKRALYMEQCVQDNPGMMVAVLDGEIETINSCCEESRYKGVVALANFNTKRQVVIGGEKSAVEEAVSRLNKAGIKLCIPLNVAGAFHTPLMQKATEQLQADLNQTEFADFHTPLISNTTAKIMPYHEISNLLARQVSEPVLFEDTLIFLQGRGVKRFIEIGPGRVLSGFVKQTINHAEILRVENEQTYQITMNQLEEEKVTNAN